MVSKQRTASAKPVSTSRRVYRSRIDLSHRRSLDMVADALRERCKAAINPISKPFVKSSRVSLFLPRTLPSSKRPKTKVPKAVTFSTWEDQEPDATSGIFHQKQHQAYCGIHSICAAHDGMVVDVQTMDELRRWLFREFDLAQQTMVVPVSDALRHEKTVNLLKEVQRTRNGWYELNVVELACQRLGTFKATLYDPVVKHKMDSYRSVQPLLRAHSADNLIVLVNAHYICLKYREDLKGWVRIDAKSELSLHPLSVKSWKAMLCEAQAIVLLSVQACLDMAATFNHNTAAYTYDGAAVAAAPSGGRAGGGGGGAAAGGGGALLKGGVVKVRASLASSHQVSTLRIGSSPGGGGAGGTAGAGISKRGGGSSRAGAQSRSQRGSASPSSSRVLSEASRNSKLSSLSPSLADASKLSVVADFKKPTAAMNVPAPRGNAVQQPPRPRIGLNRQAKVKPLHPQPAHRR